MWGIVIWGRRWESGKRVLHRGWWGPCGGGSRTPPRRGGGGTGNRGESAARSGRHVGSDSPRRRRRSAPSERRRTAPPASGRGWSSASECASERRVFWWPFWELGILDFGFLGLGIYGGVGVRERKFVERESTDVVLRERGKVGAMANGEPSPLLDLQMTSRDPSASVALLLLSLSSFFFYIFVPLLFFCCAFSFS